MARTLQPVDLAANAHLRGRFAPVYEELDAADLEVEGSVPADLTGAYLRNGPNPRFPPLGSYTYPLEGDAMIHGVWLEGGRARYRNRWVRTKGMEAEERAGRALFGGVMTPSFVDMSLLGPDPDPGWPFRLDPFINVVRHAERYLALPEGAPPYEVTGALDTVGLFDFGGALPDGICAHPKFDPTTGEMVVFRYGFEEPYLSWAVVDADGRVSRGPVTVDGVGKTFMIHDFTITERFLVLVVAPAVFDLEAMAQGGDVLSWQPELGTRIAVIPRDGSGSTRWLETDAFFVWHYANAFEAGEEILLDFPWWSDFSMGPSSTSSRAGAFVRAHLGLESGKVTLDHLDDLPGEFPRIDDRLTGRPHRYLTLARKSGRHEGLIVGEFDQLCRFDMQTGSSTGATTDMSLGEVVFAPRDGGHEELDGYYLTYGTSLADTDRSYLVMWDAGEFPSEPLAKVRMPQRIPGGLHGNWLPAA